MNTLWSLFAEQSQSALQSFHRSPMLATIVLTHETSPEEFDTVVIPNVRFLEDSINQELLRYQPGLRVPDRDNLSTSPPNHLESVSDFDTITFRSGGYLVVIYPQG